MAYRRSLITSARLVVRQRFAPSICCRDLYKNDRKDERVKRSFVQTRSYSYGNNTNSWRLGFGAMSFRDPKPITTSGFSLATRHMSTTNMEVGEVAVAAADSWLPVAAMQYAIDGIHVYTGFNWWASIVATTLVIRTLSIPIMIYQLRVTSKFDSLMPEMEKIRWEVYDRVMDVAEGQERKKRLLEKHGVTPFTPLRAIFIQGSVFASLFFAIRNMVENVPSLQTGGISWFIDLTAIDSFYILPFLGAFSFWAMAECNLKKDGALTWKLLLRGASALTLPFAASVPNALLCYWVTFNFSSLVYGLIIKKPFMMKLLKIPIVQTPSEALVSSMEALNYAPPKAMQQSQGPITSHL